MSKKIFFFFFLKRRNNFSNGYEKKDRHIFHWLLGAYIIIMYIMLCACVSIVLYRGFLFSFIFFSLFILLVICQWRKATLFLRGSTMYTTRLDFFISKHTTIYMSCHWNVYHTHPFQPSLWKMFCVPLVRHWIYVFSAHAHTSTQFYLIKY